MNSRSPSSDESIPNTTLMELQQTNDEKWQRLQQLKQDLSIEMSKNPTSSVLNNNDDNDVVPDKEMISLALQTEVDFMNSANTTLHHHCQVVAQQIQERAQRQHVTEAEIQQLDTEIIDSYEQLMYTNQVLKEQIQSERNRIRKLEEYISQHDSIGEVLRQQIIEEEVSEEALEFPVAEDERAEEEERERNERLYGHVKYVANCIQESLDFEELESAVTSRRSLSKEESNQNTHCTLEDLLLALIRRRIYFPSDSYIQLNVNHDFPIEPKNSQETMIRANPEHVKFLQDSWIVETFHDNEDLIRLRDGYYAVGI